MAKIYETVVYVAILIVCISYSHFVSNSGPGDHGGSAEDYGDPMAVLDLTGLDEIAGSDGIEEGVESEVEEGTEEQLEQPEDDGENVDDQ